MIKVIMIVKDAPCFSSVYISHLSQGAARDTSCCVYILLFVMYSCRSVWSFSGRDHFVYAPCQWETMLHCNIVSQWLGAYTKWSLLRLLIFTFWCSCHSNCSTFPSTASYSVTILLSMTLPVIRDTYAIFTSDVYVYVIVLCPVDEA